MSTADKPRRLENTVRCCRTCAFFELESVKDKAGRIRKDRVAACLWPIPDIPSGIRGSLHHGWMTASDGTECKCWTPNAAVERSAPPLRASASNRLLGENDT